MMKSRIIPVALTAAAITALITGCLPRDYPAFAVCGGGGFVETTLHDGTIVQFGPETLPDGRGWVAISPNVRVHE